MSILLISEETAHSNISLIIDHQEREPGNNSFFTHDKDRLA